MTPADLRGPVSPRRAAELDRTLKRPLIGNGAAIVKVCSETKPLAELDVTSAFANDVSSNRTATVVEMRIMSSL